MLQVIFREGPANKQRKNACNKDILLPPPEEYIHPPQSQQTNILLSSSSSPFCSEALLVYTYTGLIFSSSSFSTYPRPKPSSSFLIIPSEKTVAEEGREGGGGFILPHSHLWIGPLTLLEKGSWEHGAAGRDSTTNLGGQSLDFVIFQFQIDNRSLKNTFQW